MLFRSKLYFIYNNTASAITVKVSGQTGVSVPAAKKMLLVNDGTDIVLATNYMVGDILGNVTGNLTGNVTGNVSGSSGSCTGNAATATSATTATNATNLATTNFTVQESGGKLIFKYGSTTIASLSSAGVFTAASNISRSEEHTSELQSH